MGAGAAGDMIFGVLVYSPFLRVDTLVNGVTIESVQQYNQVAHVNCNMNVSAKAGVQYAYGYLSGTITLNAVANNTLNSDLLMSP